MAPALVKPACFEGERSHAVKSQSTDTKLDDGEPTQMMLIFNLSRPVLDAIIKVRLL